MSQLDKLISAATYVNCYECSSVHDMNYVSSWHSQEECYVYQCEECYRELSFNDAMNKKEVVIDWNSAKEYIAKSKTPKKLIKMFIDRILEEDWYTFDIDEIYEDIITNNKFLGH